MDMAIQGFGRIWYLLWKTKGKHQYLVCCYCLFSIGKLQYAYSINVNLIQKQENILVCSSLCKCCSGGAVLNFCGVLSALFESELEADEAK